MKTFFIILLFIIIIFFIYVIRNKENYQIQNIKNIKKIKKIRTLKSEIDNKRKELCSIYEMDMIHCYKTVLNYYIKELKKNINNKINLKFTENILKSLDINEKNKY